MAALVGSASGLALYCQRPWSAPEPHPAVVDVAWGCLVNTRRAVRDGLLPSCLTAWPCTWLFVCYLIQSWVQLNPCEREIAGCSCRNKLEDGFECIYKSSVYIPKKLHVRKAGSDRKCAGTGQMLANGLVLSRYFQSKDPLHPAFQTHRHGFASPRDKLSGHNPKWIIGKGNRPEMNQHLKTIQNSDDGEPKVFDGKLIVHKLVHLHPSTTLSTKNPWAWLHTKHFPFGTFSESPILQSCGRHGAGHLVVMSISSWWYDFQFEAFNSIHFSAFLRN